MTIDGHNASDRDESANVKISKTFSSVSHRRTRPHPRHQTHLRPIECFQGRRTLRSTAIRAIILFYSFFLSYRFFIGRIF